MKWTISIAAASLAVMCTSASAQSGDAMMKNDKMDVTYTGCLAAGPSGTFTLTHAMAADSHMAMDSMKDDGMKKDSMKKDSMKKDSTKKESMDKGSMNKESMKKDSMKADSTQKESMDAMKKDGMVLSSTAVDLSKHVGHKVSVTGAQVMDAFTVKSLKMVSSSCS